MAATPGSKAAIIELTAVALSDLKRVQTFLAHQNPKAAADALAVIETAIDQLEKFPLLGKPIADLNIRQHYVRFGKGGYVIRYVPETEDNVIVITRIWHSREARE